MRIKIILDHLYFVRGKVPKALWKFWVWYVGRERTTLSLTKQLIGHDEELLTGRAGTNLVIKAVSFLSFFFWLSHHLCWPQRHCSRYPPTSSQRSTGGDVRLLVGCPAAKSLRWCSVVPGVIEHRQDTNNYASYWWQCWLSSRVRLSEHPPRPLSDELF